MISAFTFLAIMTAFVLGFTIAIVWIVLDEEKNRREVMRKTNPGEEWERLFENQK